jgi:hypothetical protein
LKEERKTIMRRTIISVGLVLMALATWAQPGFKTKSISVFKNGSAFFIKEANVETKNGSYLLSEKIPQPLFGTFWVYSTSNELKSLSSYKDTVATKTEANSMIELLKANKGMKLILHRKDDQIKGTVETVNNQFLTMNADGKWFATNWSDIIKVEFASKPNNKFNKEEEKQVVKIDFTSDKKKQNIEMMYMQNGLGWLPNYHIELVDKTKAKLSLRAVLINDAEDIENTDLNFVVGVPNFKYANMVSPLVGIQQVAGFLNSLGGAYRQMGNELDNRILANDIRTQSISYGIDNTNSGTFTGTGFESLDGKSQEDLFFYSIKGVSLKKGGRAFHDILKTEVPIEHIYEAQLSSNGENSNYRSALNFSENMHNKVWHSIKITNNSSQPFTTGTAMVTKKDGTTQQPISEDRLAYTPQKGESFLKLTIAPDVRIADSEKEVKREQSAKKYKGYNYDLVTVEGEIKVANHKNEKVALNVKRSIVGKLSTSTPDWLTSKQVRLYGLVNETNDVCWELKLDANEKKTIKYQYQIYIRH